MSEKNNKDVIDSLENLLANINATYSLAQLFHWNVTGPNFKSLHELFEEIYTDLAIRLDETAERIRALGEKILRDFRDRSSFSLDDQGEVDGWPDMLKHLILAFDSIRHSAKIVLEKAEANNDDVTISLIDDLRSSEQKFVWMLKSTLE
jgi:starvation-inducible DNA-binding protein